MPVTREDYAAAKAGGQFDENALAELRAEVFKNYLSNEQVAEAAKDPKVSKEDLDQMRSMIFYPEEPKSPGYQEQEYDSVVPEVVAKGANLVLDRITPAFAAGKYLTGKAGIKYAEPVTGKQMLGYLPIPGEAAPTIGEMTAGKDASPWVKTPIDIVSGMASGTISKPITALNPEIGKATARSIRDKFTNWIFPYLKNKEQSETVKSLTKAEKEIALRSGISEDDYEKLLRENTVNPVDVLAKHNLLYAPEKAMIRSDFPMRKADMQSMEILTEASSKGPGTPWSTTAKNYEAALDSLMDQGKLNAAEKLAAQVSAEKIMAGVKDTSLLGTANRVKEINKRVLEAKKAMAPTAALEGKDYADQSLLKTLKEDTKSDISSILGTDKLEKYKQSQQNMAEIMQTLPYISEEAYKKFGSSALAGVGAGIAESTVYPRGGALRVGKSLTHWLVPDKAIMALARGAEGVARGDKIRNAAMTPWFTMSSKAIENRSNPPETQRVNK